MVSSCNMAEEFKSFTGCAESVVGISDQSAPQSSNASSAVAEMGDHLVTVDMGRKVE